MQKIDSFYYRYLRYFMAKDEATATSYDKYLALSYAVRSRMVDKWIATQKSYHVNNARRIYYLSPEYVLGRNLKQNILNLAIEDEVAHAAKTLGFSLNEIYDQEDDFDLGNGGKGRVAAVIQEAMAKMDIAGMGYGLHYDYAAFHQEIINEKQVEKPYDWLHRGHPWEIVRPQYACSIYFNGKIKQKKNKDGEKYSVWCDREEIKAIPYDFPVSGYKTETVNTIRFWSARPSEGFLTDYQNHGDYIRACEDKFQYERVTKILFPDSGTLKANEIYIKQQYFYISAALQDIIRRYLEHNSEIDSIDKKVVVHLNGGQCGIAPVEMLRLLIDEHQVSWEKAWEIVKKIFTYTTHIASKDSFHLWPVYLLEHVLPRHMELIYKINYFHINNIKEKAGEATDLIKESSIIEEGDLKRVRMDYLTLIASSAVNGVSKSHTEWISKSFFNKVNKYADVPVMNITNGIAYRRWLKCANNPLANLISEVIGSSWEEDPCNLRKLEDFKDDDEFKFRLGDLKYAAKRYFLEKNQAFFDFKLDTNAFWDVQCTKIQPYKRQILHLLYIVQKYLSIKRGEDLVTYRIHIFGGKAVPSNNFGKQTIQLINILKRIINSDPATENKLKIVFLPNYGMRQAEYIIPAADLSEQLALPGLEACGTSSIKYALNGAVIIASRNGVNLEMYEHIGPEDLVIFGRDEKQIIEERDGYNPSEYITDNALLCEVFEFLEKVASEFDESEKIRPLIASLMDNDEYFVLADFIDYIEKQKKIDELYLSRSKWLAMGVKNIARVSYFTSDRAIKEYSDNLWKVN